MSNNEERTIGMILEKLDAQHETLKEVKEQVLKTNGRVQSLEKWRVGLSVAIAIAAGLGVPNISVIAKSIIGI